MQLGENDGDERQYITHLPFLHRSMNRIIVLGIALALAVALVAVPLGAAQTAGIVADDEDDEPDVEPGEHLAGVVGVQGAELDGEVTDRAVGIAVAKAATNESAQADLVADRLGDVEERLDAIETRQAELEAARSDGEISEGQYRAQMARQNAEAAGTDRLIDHLNETANGLPAEALAERGVDVAAIHEANDRAAAALETGPGLGVGPSFNDPPGQSGGPSGPPSDTPGGPPGDGNESDDDESDDDEALGGLLDEDDDGPLDDTLGGDDSDNGTESDDEGDDDDGLLGGLIGDDDDADGDDGDDEDDDDGLLSR